MSIKIKLILVSTFLLLFNMSLQAKDILIPSDIDGNSLSTLYDYELNKSSQLKLSKENTVSNQLKEVYNFDDQWSRYRLLDYIDGLTDLLDFSFADFVFNAPGKYFVVRINPIPKEIIEEKPQMQYYNIASLELQSDLQCPVTPTVKHIDYNKPKHFNITNNLRRAVKTTIVASGDIVYIKGHVQDINCVPIQNAKINVWQLDGYGKLKSNKESDMYFIGNGTATSDNMGNFSFITILPQQETLGGVAPHINLSIQHREFGKMDTKMYFAKHIMNTEDKTLAELDEFSKSLIIAEMIPVELSKLDEGYFMMFDLTLNRVSSYRRL